MNLEAEQAQDLHCAKNDIVVSGGIRKSQEVFLISPGNMAKRDEWPLPECVLQKHSLSWNIMPSCNRNDGERVPSEKRVGTNTA